MWGRGKVRWVDKWIGREGEGQCWEGRAIGRGRQGEEGRKESEKKRESREERREGEGRTGR